MIGLLRSVLRKLGGGGVPAQSRTLTLSDGRVYVLLAPSGQAVVDLNSLSGPNRHLESEEGLEYRSQVALELMDGDVYGFMLLALKGGDTPEVVFRAQSDPVWDDVFAAALGRIALAL